MRIAKNNSFSYIYVGIQLASLALFLSMLSVFGKMEAPILFLPLSFFLVNLLFYSNYVRQELHLTKLLVLGLYFVRLSAVPFLYFASGETRLFEGRVIMSSGSLEQAFWLMVYEYLVVQLVIFLHENVKLKGFQIKLIWSQKNKYRFFPIVLCFMAFFAVAVYLLMPEVRGAFKNILMLGEKDFTSSGYQPSSGAVGSIRRILGTLFSVVFAMLRILLPSYFLVRAKKKGRSGILVLFISLAAQFLFITSTFAQSVVAAFTVVLLFGHLYPEKRKFLFFMLGSSTVGIVALFFLVRYSVGSGMYSDGKSLITYIARIASAYFTGIENVAGCFNVEKGFELETALSDFIGAIPFNSTLIRGWDGDKFQTYFNAANRSYGQISPAIGSGYYHFGTLLSPIYTVIMLKLSMFYHERAKKSSPSRYAANVFCCIVFALGLVMYNEAIAFSWYFGWGLLMLLALKFSNKDESV